MSFVKSPSQLFSRDEDADNVGLHLREFCAGEDETEVPIGRDLAVRIALGEEAVFASLYVVAVTSTERACEGLTLFC